jgi:hypothetical protein
MSRFVEFAELIGFLAQLVASVQTAVGLGLDAAVAHAVGIVQGVPYTENRN